MTQPIPGTVIFDGEQARKGYALNKMCYSFNDADNRRTFVTDEDAYCARYGLNAQQREAIGAAAGGRVAYFLETDDFARDHAAMSARGVRFLESPRREAYGTVAVFADPWGGRWDLLQPAKRQATVAP